MDHFLTKSVVDLSECLSIGDGIALDEYPRLHKTLRDRAGPEAARLFAEPLVSRGNDESAPSISWYTDVEGSGQPLDRLDAAAQADVTARLTRDLKSVEPLIDDREIGPLVASALHVRSTSDVWVVDNKPLILNWGMLPADVARDSESRAQHYNRTMGRFLPLSAAPPLFEDERETRAQTQRAAAAAAAAGTVAAAAPPTPPPETKTVERTRRVPPGWGFVPLAGLLVLAAAILIWLLIPGNRIIAERPEPVVTDTSALAAAEEVNRNLKDRLARLQNALDNAVCQSDGTLLMPDGATIEGLLPPDPLDPTDRPGSVRQAKIDPVLPPQPERVQVETPEAGDGLSNLIGLIDARTALVMAQGETGLSTGTGFFVGPDLLVSNFHVIENAAPGQLFVTNPALGELKRAQVLKQQGPMQETGGDFALLRVEGANQPSFTVLNTEDTLRLQSVVAAGYPGDILRVDAEFQALRQGEMTAVPELALTDGSVISEQSLSAVTKVYLHSAPISTGNSGGPLIDMCGRLVGVNTFVLKGSMRNLNFALSGRDLMRFLQGTAALPQVVSTGCQPQVQRPTVAQAQSGTATPPPVTTPLPPLQPLPPLTSD